MNCKMMVVMMLGALLGAGCGPSEPDEAKLFEGQRQALEKARGVEQQLQDLEEQRRRTLDQTAE